MCAPTQNMKTGVRSSVTVLPSRGAARNPGSRPCTQRARPGACRRGAHIVDSALEMVQRLAHTQAEFLRKVVDSAGKSLSRSQDTR